MGSARPGSIWIAPSEIECTYVRSSGPGGQNVNKVSSKCQLRWNALASVSLPPAVHQRVLTKLANRLTTDGSLIITSDRYRDQRRNRDDCLDKLHSLIAEAALKPKARKATRPTRASQRKRETTKKEHGKKKGLRGRVRDY